MNAPATFSRSVHIERTPEKIAERAKRRAAKIIGNAEAIFQEAHGHGLAGEFFDPAWSGSEARRRLMQPAKTAMSAIERRDRTLYFFEEGLRAGHSGTPADFAWKQSYSLLIATDLAERVNLRDG